MEGSGYRVLVVDDHASLAESWVLALQMQGIEAARFPPSELAVGADDLVAAVRRREPDLVLLDLDLGPFGDAAPLVGRLRAAGLEVVVATASSDVVRLGSCLAAGALAVLAKSRPLADLVAVVRRCRDGEPAMAPEEREALLAPWRDAQEAEAAADERFARLTAAEREVLQALMDGRHVADIARDRSVAESTVRSQVKAVLAKLEVPSQLAAVGLAHRSKWSVG